MIRGKAADIIINLLKNPTKASNYDVSYEDIINLRRDYDKISEQNKVNYFKIIKDSFINKRNKLFRGHIFSNRTYINFFLLANDLFRSELFHRRYIILKKLSNKLTESMIKIINNYDYFKNGEWFIEEKLIKGNPFKDIIMKYYGILGILSERINLGNSNVYVFGKNSVVISDDVWYIFNLETKTIKDRFTVKDKNCKFLLLHDDIIFCSVSNYLTVLGKEFFQIKTFEVYDYHSAIGIQRIYPLQNGKFLIENNRNSNYDNNLGILDIQERKFTTIPDVSEYMDSLIILNDRIVICYVHEIDIFDYNKFKFVGRLREKIQQPKLVINDINDISDIKAGTSLIVDVIPLAGGRIACVTIDRDIEVWNINTLSFDLLIIAEITNYPDLSLLPIDEDTIAFSTRTNISGNIMLSGIRVFNLKTGMIDLIINADTHIIEKLVLINKHQLMSVSRSRTKVWNIKTGDLDVVFPKKYNECFERHDFIIVPLNNGHIAVVNKNKISYFN